MACTCTCPDASCSCPPDYNIDPLTVECQSGTSCEDAILSDCVISTVSMECYGAKTGDTLTTILGKLNDGCPLNPNVIANILRIIGSDPELMVDFCTLVGNCSGSVPISGTIPIIVSIIMP